MAVTAKWYGVPIKNQYDGTRVIDFDTDTMKTALTTSSYSVAQDTDDHFNDVTNEITGTGYTAGGVTVSSPTFTAGGTNNSVATFTSATNPSWAGATFSANQAVLYQSSASTYQLGAFWDFGGSVSVTAGTFTLTINASGLLTATVS